MLSNLVVYQLSGSMNVVRDIRSKEPVHSKYSKNRNEEEKAKEKQDMSK